MPGVGSPSAPLQLRPASVTALHPVTSGTTSSSPHAGECGADPDGAVCAVAAPAGHRPGELDPVVDALERTGVQRIAAVRERTRQVAKALACARPRRFDATTHRTTVPVEPGAPGAALATEQRKGHPHHQYGDDPMIRIKKGEHVRWYLITVGEGLNLHTPHWHGNTVLVNGHRTAVILLGPAMMVTAAMWPDDRGQVAPSLRCQ